VVLSILAMIAMAAVAFLCAVQGVYRAAQVLVAFVLAAALAFGLFAPVSGMVFGSSEDPAGVWYYAGDAFCLWVILCVVFLGLRTAGERFLPNEPAFPVMADRIGGAALGLVAGYLVVGVCLVLIQMLPVGPRFLGYEAFAHVEGTSEADPERVEPGERLWLAPDRGALAFFAYAVSGPLGSADAPLLNQYGDVYPPDEMRADGYQAVTDVDDVLYYHWYRRWLAIRWRTGAVMGPIPEVAKGSDADRGLTLDRNRAATLYGMSLRISRADRLDAIQDFPKEQPPQGEEFLAVAMRFQAVERWPRAVDSSQFYLIDPGGERVGGPPRIHGPAKRPSPTADAQKAEVVSVPAASTCTPRNLRFSFAEGKRDGRYLMDGATFYFAEKRQYEPRTFVFTVPKATPTEGLRLLLDPKPPSLAAPGPADESPDAAGAGGAREAAPTPPAPG